MSFEEEDYEGEMDYPDQEDKFVNKIAQKQEEFDVDFELKLQKARNRRGMDKSDKAQIILIANQKPPHKKYNQYKNLNPGREMKPLVFDKTPSAEELLTKQVTNKLRVFIRKQLFGLFSEYIPEVTSKEPTRLTNLPAESIFVIPWGHTEIKEKEGVYYVEWEFDNLTFTRPFRNLKDANDFAAKNYYSTEFNRWEIMKRQEEVEKALPEKELREQAVDVTKNFTPEAIMKNFSNVYGNNTPGIDGMIKLMGIAEHPSHFDVFLKSKLIERKKSSIKIKDMRKFVNEIAVEYSMQDFLKPDHIYQELKNAWIAKTISEITMTDQGRNEFEQEIVPILVAQYRQTIKNARARFDRNNKYMTDKGIKLSRDIEIYEEDCYVLFGKTIFDYLTKILTPFVFLKDLKTYTQFFQAKIKSGKFKVDKLVGANLAEYIPELSAEVFSIPEKKWNDKMKILGGVFRERVLSMLDMYRNLLNPTLRVVPRKVGIPRLETTSVVQTCQDGSKTGKVEGVDSKGRKIMVDRDLDDTIIYRDVKSGKFSCHSIMEIVADFKKGDYENKVTNERFPESFIKKMKERYID